MPKLPTEAQEQIWITHHLDRLGLTYFHVPNGGHRRIQTASLLKKMGVKSGVPDLIILEPPPAHPDAKGLVMEVKRSKGGSLSRNQEDWLERFKGAGWIAIVCKGAEDAYEQLQTLGYGPEAGCAGA